MTKLAHFGDTQHAVERGRWNARKSAALYEASQRVIEKSVQLIEEAGFAAPTFESGE